MYLFRLLVLWLLPTSLFAQIQLSGKVIDIQTKEPLAGATVELLGTSQNLISNPNGTFQFIDLAPNAYTIRIRYLGYQTLEQTLQLERNLNFTIELTPERFLAKELLVVATRATSTTPSTLSTLSKVKLREENLGQDVPILLGQLPSTVSTSDAGAGIGYTGMRIRGTDATGINVTINGVPYNDAESLGTFWVDLPDIIASTENVQVQRGVGTSTNGAGAFGATINLQTTILNAEPFATVDNTFGSYNTRKHSIQLGSGLIHNHWAFSGRYSYLNSDGYIDRSQANLTSYYLSGGYYGKKTVVQAISFSGSEITQQAWYGTPQSRLDNDEAGMLRHAQNNGYSEAQLENLLSSGRTYNYYLYDNEIDDYTQNHYQLHLSHQLNPQSYLNGALHYTHGQGFFEQFREDDTFESYGIGNPSINQTEITSADFIRRRWLENDFYGATFNYIANYNKVKLTLGSAYNAYEGNHFGEIIWSSIAETLHIRDRYYESKGIKKDANIFAKLHYKLIPNLQLYGDAQVRHIDYEADGLNNDLVPIDIAQKNTFINPKVGVFWEATESTHAFLSFSLAHREPTRSDYVDAPSNQLPTSEKLQDIELGIRHNKKSFNLRGTVYYMKYKDQLILTGALNDVGAPLRQNVPNSYRLGLEVEGEWQVSQILSWTGNMSLSKNKIKDFNEIVYDYTRGFDVLENHYTDVSIAYSPTVVANSQLKLKVLEKLNLTWRSQFVGKQYLDNTQQTSRSIPAFFVNDAKIMYSPQLSSVKNTRFFLQINNVLNELYASNGYTYSYIYGDQITENFYYPQATRNFLCGVTLDF